MIWAVGFRFCGSATAVEDCHRQSSKSRLSAPASVEGGRYDLGGGIPLLRKRHGG